jgi:hypothetical protein
VIAAKGGASEPPDTLLLGKAGGAVAVRRTLATTICRIADPTQVSRPRQLRDASTVMRFRPAHQRMINRRHDDRASCLVRHSLKQLLSREPRIQRAYYLKRRTLLARLRSRANLPTMARRIMS